MAKKSQSFADKVARHGGESRKMAKLVIAEKKPNGHFSFRTRMVPADDISSAIKKAKGQ